MVSEITEKTVFQSNKRLNDLCVNTIRFLAIDTTENAGAGHPGTPMGIAPVAHFIYTTSESAFHSFLQFNPRNPFWVNRDRFVLSNGHASELLYSMLYLCGYESITLEDLKKFRQIHSCTPGHPENIETAGVEITTGPLGQGIATAVGLAAAEAHLAAVYNRPDCNLIDHYTYVFMGDGCIMEGVSYEASSLAGHLQLGKLIAIYDDNHITVDGNINCTFSEDIEKRFQAFGWHVVTVENGDTNLGGIYHAIQLAKQMCDKPSLIHVKTTIGYGSPTKANSPAAHGAPLGKEEVMKTRQALQWPFGEFEVPTEVLQHYRRHVSIGQKLEKEWNIRFDAYRKKYPELASQFERTVLNKELPESWQNVLVSTAEQCGDMATRQASRTMLNALAPIMPQLIGGSADLACSCLTSLDNIPKFQNNCKKGREIYFGVREHAMAAISNGLYLHQTGLRPFASTFFSFTDYMRPSIRLQPCPEQQSFIL
eukprot:jgi/Galph1/3842/GphlegSOOS_G2486.1